MSNVSNLELFSGFVSSIMGQDKWNHSTCERFKRDLGKFRPEMNSNTNEEFKNMCRTHALWYFPGDSNKPRFYYDGWCHCVECAVSIKIENMMHEAENMTTMGLRQRINVFLQLETELNLILTRNSGRLDEHLDKVFGSLAWMQNATTLQLIDAKQKMMDNLQAIHDCIWSQVPDYECVCGRFKFSFVDEPVTVEDIEREMVERMVWMGIDKNVKNAARQCYGPRNWVKPSLRSIASQIHNDCAGLRSKWDNLDLGMSQAWKEVHVLSKVGME